MSNKTIVITRPSGQARQLSEALQASLVDSGFTKDTVPQIISLPLLTIVPKGDDVLVERITAALKSADLAIFVSPNAIECTMRLLERSWQEVSDRPLPIGVMGGSSLAALNNHGIGLESNATKVILPQSNAQWDSEGLWSELQALNWEWSTKKVIIFKGEGGRDWLAETLKQAGAQVEAFSVYTRVPLDLNSSAWNDVHEMDFAKSLWLLTSSEAVRYLGQATLSLDLASAMCPHHNIASAAEQIGFGKVFTCEPGDEALIAASRAWLFV
ncbi:MULTISPECIES: uroporphyrinogen-III synthase [unclassified Polynucleobacter]|uniref:uroporphyrinogen-III synthase n=1 Tax=unclassified Polynucleobacter TaxID=2640945 RepID=UPI000BC5DE84|nr:MULTISPECIES: uroporphyrinogen-III synthase [unclassified Polynucleobacter]OYY13694.1 MAG: uroporphyrinogen III synthase [Polynucleobacter sp. 35-46-11]OZA73793.1 MAG: uroporphyrinogen III synthase [Polynucleobacter sp. 39-46-10]